MKKKALLCGILAALLLAGSLAQVSLQRSGPGEAGDRAAGEGSSGVNYLDFLGGIRQFLGYVLWIRTDSMHHSYYPSLDLESELIPYFLLISYLNPQYVDAYYVGSSVIFYAGNEQEAIDFILEGIANNPGSGDLYAGLADFYMRQGRYLEAREAYQQAAGKQLEIVDIMYVTTGIAAASTAMGDTAGAISAKREQLDYYRLALLREGLTPDARDYIVWRINLLEDRIGELRGTIAESVSGEENQ